MGSKCRLLGLFLTLIPQVSGKASGKGSRGLCRVKLSLRQPGSAGPEGFCALQELQDGSKGLPWAHGSPWILLGFWISLGSAGLQDLLDLGFWISWILLGPLDLSGFPGPGLPDLLGLLDPAGLLDLGSRIPWISWTPGSPGSPWILLELQEDPIGLLNLLDPWVSWILLGSWVSWILLGSWP